MTEKVLADAKTGWIMIIIGGILQAGCAVGLDYTNSFTDILWDAIVVVFLVLSMICLYKAIDSVIGFSVSYVVWIAIGVFGAIIVSLILGLEVITLPMVFFILLMMGGVVGLRSNN